MLYKASAGRPTSARMHACRGEELENRILLSGSPTLVRDLDVKPNGSAPTNLTEFQSGLVFSATSEFGRELWKSDGTEQGTELVADLNPGDASSYPHELVVLGNQLFFVADGGDGNELWTTDGTEQGTARVVAGGGSGDLRPINPTALTMVNDALFFVTDDGLLWQATGSQANVVAGSDGHDLNGLSELTAFGDELFFVAFGLAGRELWSTDGQSISQVSQLTAVAADVELSDLVVLGDELFFQSRGDGRSELWKTDGTASGTELVRDFGGERIQSVTATEEAIYFLTSTDDRIRLWQSDGSDEGTVDLSPEVGDGSFAPNVILPAQDGVLLSNSFTGEVWGNDGKSDTRHVGLVPVFRYATIDSALVDEQQFLLGETALWKTDGTESGTVLVSDIGAGDKYQPDITEVEGTLYFNGVGAEGAELWKSDGTAVGTQLVADIFPGLAPDGDDPGAPAGLHRVGDDVYIFFHRGLAISDGTEEGTRMILDQGGSELIDLGGDAVFVSGSELWRSDGTSSATRMIHPFPEEELIEQFRFPRPRELTLLGEEIFFSVDSHDLGRELWKTNGTSEGTKLVKDLQPLGGANPTELTVFDGELYFRANHNQLWKTDGTDLGTTLVRDFGPLGVVEPFQMHVVGNTMYFIGGDSEYGRELWRTDGSGAEPLMVKDIRDGLGSALSATSELTAVGDTLFFTATSDGLGASLWKSDGTAGGTVEVYATTGTFAPEDLTASNGVLLFTLYEETVGRELWVSDGTTAGTHLVRDVAPGPAASDPQHLIAYNDKLYFTANEVMTGRELWESDGTADGTRLVADIWSGSESSEPSDLIVVGSQLFFIVNDGVHDRELWTIDTTAIISGDFDGDGEVGFADFLILATNFGQTGVTAAEGDLDGDQAVTFADFLMFTDGFGSGLGNTEQSEERPAIRSSRRDGFS